MKSLFVFAGDVSADNHTSKVVAQLKKQSPDLKIWGIGGQKMKAAGVELLYDLETFACFGIIEVIKFIPFLAKLRAEILEQIELRKPDTVLLVDFAGFNLRLAAAIRKNHKNMPIIYFISPQVWGSRPWRIKSIVNTVTKMLVIFPFEESIYRKKNIDTVFVGHPLTSKPIGTISKEEFCQKYQLDPSKFIVGIFPGSRKQEIQDHAPVLLSAIKWLGSNRTDIQFVLSQANSTLAQEFEKHLKLSHNQNLLGSGLTLVPGDENQTLMNIADVLWAKSGTTTLEAALFGKPMLIFYRANWISFLLFLLFKQVQQVGWPNILAGKEIVPELLQLDCRAQKFVRYTSDWLDVEPARQEIGQHLMSVKQSLGSGDFAYNAATEILKTLSSTSDKALTQIG